MEGIFHLDPGCTWRYLWFVGSDEGDLMAMTFDSPVGVGARFRTRCYVDDEAFDSNDQKKVYDVQLPVDAPPQDADEAMRKLAKASAAVLGGEFYELKIFGDGKALFEALKPMPWAHIREVQP